MQNRKKPPVNLDEYIQGEKRKYITYEAGARLYSMPYWTFVKVAKEANATWCLRKTAILDMNVLDKYLDEHYSVAREDVNYAREEVIKMARGRKKVENIEELVGSKAKKYIRYAEGAELYSMGLHTFESLAKDAGAIRRVKGIVLVNIERIEAFIESFAEEG